MGKKSNGKKAVKDGRTMTDEELVAIVEPIIKPEEHPPGKVRKCKRILREFIRKNQVGRERLCTALMALGIEPVDTRKTQLFKIAPRHIPLRTRKEAWEIVVKNQALASYAANIIGNTRGVDNVPKEVVRQEMTIALFWDVLFWDEKKGTLSTFFMRNSMRACKKELLRIALGVKFPLRLVDSILRYEATVAEHPHLPREKIAGIMDIEPEKVEKIAMAARKLKSAIKPTPADNIFYSIPPSEEMIFRTCSYTRINDRTAMRKMVIKEPDNGDYEKMKQDVHAALKTLSERQQKVLRMRFGFNGSSKKKMTFKEIGKRLGITKQWAGQIEKTALDKLRNSAHFKLLKAHL